MNKSVRQWIERALEDEAIARHELTFPKNEVATGPVCLHCQQMVEKLLKAFLVNHNIEFEKTHDLERLIHLCEQQDKKFSALYVGDLTFYAVEARYPSEFYVPDFDEAKENYRIAIKAKEFLLKLLEE